MRQIDGYPLWLGNARDARDVKAVLDAGIEAVVDLAMEEPPAVLTRELTYLRFPLVDGEGNPYWRLMAALIVVEGLIRLRVPTLVACGAGMSRSLAIAAGGRCLATDQRAPDMVLRSITKGAGPADVHPALWNDIVRCFLVDDGTLYGRNRSPEDHH
jgi:hypothetical protein